MALPPLRAATGPTKRCGAPTPSSPRWRPTPAGVYADAATEVLDAFAGADVLEASFALPELGPGAAFPGTMAIGFHHVDYVVHGWDVARALGRSYELPDEVVAAAVPLAFVVPDGDFRTADGAVFGPAVPSTGESGDLDRILAHLGPLAAVAATRRGGQAPLVVVPAGDRR